jgi:hypothetical protein
MYSQELPASKTLAESRIELLKQLGALEASRINPLDFRGVSGFSDEEIVEDARKVENNRLVIAEKIEQMSPAQKSINEDGRIVESLLRACIREASWLGKDTRLILPSLFDDYFRGIDMITEFSKDPTDPRHIGFGVDFTIASEELAHKLTGIIKSVSDGFAPSVKYFESPVLGKRKNVWMPKVVLAADYQSVKRVADAFVEARSNGRPVKGILENDPLQFVLLDEVRGQLTAFRNIAYEMYGNKKAGGLYHRALMSFLDMLEEKGLTKDVLEKGSRGDSLHGRILSMIGKFDREYSPKTNS